MGSPRPVSNMYILFVNEEADSQCRRLPVYALADLKRVSK